MKADVSGASGRRRESFCRKAGCAPRAVYLGARIGYGKRPRHIRLGVRYGGSR